MEMIVKPMTKNRRTPSGENCQEILASDNFNSCS